MSLDTTINDPSEDLLQVRSRICNMMLMASAVLALPAVSASLYRSVNIGWRWEMALHVVSALALWGLLIYKKSIPYPVRAGSIVSIFLFTGLAGFWAFGLVSGANPMLLMAPVLATVLFGKRTGIIVTIGIVLMMVLTAYSFIYGGRVFIIDFNVTAPYLPGWIAYTLVVIMSVATIISAISMSNQHLEQALLNSKQSEHDLERQVVERTLELEDAKQKAEQQARTDVLTGLNNRRAFFEYAEVIDAQSRRYNHTYVIAMIDIDHFKAVNDTWGHDTGDCALKAISHIILDVLRETDIVGRIGGEEFVAILPETTITEGAALAERLRATIEESAVETTQAPITVTISIGVAALGDLNGTLDGVVAHADAAMYQAKNDGRNKVQLHAQAEKVVIGA